MAPYPTDQRERDPGGKGRAAGGDRRLPYPLAAGTALGLWVPYAVLNTLFPGPALTYTLGLAVAGLALGLLRLAGLERQDLFVCLARPSREGAAVLATLLLFVPLALMAGRGQAWNPMDDLVYAPASALAQELYFRAALLAVVTRLWRGHRLVPIVVQALLFALWHVRAYRVVAIPQASGVLALVFAGGLAWGWQVNRDRTVAFAALEHTIFLIVQ